MAAALEPTERQMAYLRGLAARVNQTIPELMRQAGKRGPLTRSGASRLIADLEKRLGYAGRQRSLRQAGWVQRLEGRRVATGEDASEAYAAYQTARQRAQENPMSFRRGRAEKRAHDELLAVQQRSRGYRRKPSAPAHNQTVHRHVHGRA